MGKKNRKKKEEEREGRKRETFAKRLSVSHGLDSSVRPQCMAPRYFGKCLTERRNYTLFENSIIIKKTHWGTRFIFNSRKLVQNTHPSEISCRTQRQGDSGLHLLLSGLMRPLNFWFCKFTSICANFILGIHANFVDDETNFRDTNLGEWLYQHLAWEDPTLGASYTAGPRQSHS